MDQHAGMSIVTTNQSFTFAVFALMLIALPSRNRIMVHLIYTDNKGHMYAIRYGHEKIESYAICT